MIAPIFTQDGHFAGYTLSVQQLLINDIQSGNRGQSQRGFRPRLRSCCTLLSLGASFFSAGIGNELCTLVGGKLFSLLLLFMDCVRLSAMDT
jgi:hypothetical protein